MYALASFGLRGLSRWSNVTLCGTWSIYRGSNVRFGVVWSPPLCCCFCVAGGELGASAGNLMYALPSFGLAALPVTPSGSSHLAQGVSVQAVLQLIIALRVSRCLFLSFDCVSFGVLCSARVSSGAFCVG